MKDKIPVSKVLIENREGKFLAVRETESGHWELPGGKIEEDEDRFSAARREVEEETGLKTEKLEELMRVDVHRDYAVKCWMFHTRKFSGELSTNNPEVDNTRWVSSEEFHALDWSIDAGFNIAVMKLVEEE